MGEFNLGWGDVIWVPCAKCGQEVLPSAADGCWACKQAAQGDKGQEALYARARFPETYRWATPSHAAISEMAHRFGVTGPDAGTRLIQRCVRGPERIVTLTGPTRCGKTSLAAAALQDRIAEGLFVESAELGAAASSHGFGSGDAPLVTRSLRTRLLVLDELQVHAVPSQRDAVWRVVHQRHRAGRLTVITTGVPRPLLVEAYGEGFEGRVFMEALQLDCGTGVVVRGVGVSESGPVAIGGFRGRSM